MSFPTMISLLVSPQVGDAKYVINSHRDVDAVLSCTLLLVFSGLKWHILVTQSQNIHDSRGLQTSYQLYTLLSNPYISCCHAHLWSDANQNYSVYIESMPVYFVIQYNWNTNWSHNSMKGEYCCNGRGWHIQPYNWRHKFELFNICKW